ncbi:hypothetical protein NQ318_001648 [Aromia moschata]|uniref:B30.2/SPRY domain-containing protein n=1 Tax=Aromia moschata TaxID=1265417 RepID=A0AAV8XYM1_9CUCU|nr:hypothetical protein NQ318_001648 [Aromia moschata]
MVLRLTVVNDDWQPDELLRDQENDPNLKPIVNWKKEGRKPTWEEVSRYSPTVKSYWAQWNSLVLSDGLLKRVLEKSDGTEERKQLIVPRNRVPEVLEEVHNGSTGGHLGVTKTLGKVRERFYWVNCTTDVKEWCKKCVEVYCGIETICTVDGLHFHCMYNARVKAFNSSGEGEYSELIGLQTAEDKYDADTDPAFGIARIDVTRDKMLGKDDKGWAMYIDRQRSWFQHAGAHEQRVEGGIHVGSTIGVLLDLDQHILSFYVNEEPQGSVAFRDLYGVFYPAVSINRGVSITVHTALDPPSDSDET